MKTIILKFSGPLQSWGGQSNFETRQTDRYPTKSAVIGMIAACLGYRRDDERIEKLNDLQFAVRVDQAGNLIKDYHTAKKYNKKGVLDDTYVTERYYIEDAVFVVAIGHEDEALVSMIEQAIRNPYFPPFMGRRSLPLPVDILLQTTDKTVMDSIIEVPWQASSWLKWKSRKDDAKVCPIYVDTSLLKAEPDGRFAVKSTKMRKDRVVSFSQKNRQLAFRSESMTKVTLVIKDRSMEHDALAALGE